MKAETFVILKKNKLYFFLKTDFAEMDFFYGNLSFDAFIFQGENDLGSEKEMETSPGKISPYFRVEVCRAVSVNQPAHLTVNKVSRETAY